MPPIYQPEVAARAIVWAAEHPRRDLPVGIMTVAAMQGNKLIPGLLDRYLALTGYESQQTDLPVSAGRPDNLRRPLPGDHGAHGMFDARAHASSWQLWLTTHRGPLLAAAGLLAGASLLLAAGMRERMADGARPTARSRRLPGRRRSGADSGSYGSTRTSTKAGRLSAPTRSVTRSLNRKTRFSET